MPFDTLSKMISLHTNTTAVDELNQSLSLGKNRQRAAQIIHSMVYLRNICSHHWITSEFLRTFGFVLR